MPQQGSAPYLIAVIVTPRFNLAATTGFLDPLRVANYLNGSALFRWSIHAVDPGPVEASSGLSLAAAPLSQIPDRPDLVMISSSWTPEDYGSELLLARLRRWARMGAMLGGLDTGAFLLAKAGLLEGQRATVHYEHLDAFIELFPDVEATEELFVLDRARLTCCGGSAATDLALHLLRSLHGDGLANAAARYVFHESLRPEGTLQFPQRVEPLGSTAPSALRQAIRLMEANLETPVAIPKICAGVGLSQRQLERLFSTYVRKSPQLYYRDIRLDRARGLVTQTELRLSEIAYACGFSSPMHFSRSYRERFGLPPSKDRVQGRIPFEFRAWPMHRGAPDDGE
ncbi:GlxA family transcriptional regulator [Nioella aestuarii]|uniref:GlxA family transcriptional regulator n=1 Tax=Nioella aestuarii TaxID=1662864 RepID=UPI003D7FB2D5